MLVDPDLPFEGILRKLDTGLYEILHRWHARSVFKGWVEHDYQWPELQGDVDTRLKALSKMFQEGTYVYTFGSCDSPEQFMAHEQCGKLLLRLPHKYCVTFSYDTKETAGGRRWHKNGPHFGQHEPQCESLWFEPVINEIYSFHIYRKIE